MILLILALAGGILLAVGLYNHQIALRHRTFEAWAGIDVQLKRRHDLIPQLVEAVKGYGRYETGLLNQLTLARAQETGPQNPSERAPVEKELSKGLRNLLAVAEAYPDLKANQQFLALQNTLTQVENELQMARRYYNGTVRDYNISIQSIPGNMIAPIAGFKKAGFFEIEYATERAVPDFSFSKPPSHASA